MRIVQVRSIPMPIRQGARAWKPWQGGMHVKGYIQWMLSATFRDENYTLSRIHVSIVVDMIPDLSATCGLNFRSDLPCCVGVKPVFQKSRCAVHLLMEILFCRCSLCFFTIPLCVWFFVYHGSSKIRIGSQFFWFPVVLPPIPLFLGVPLSQRFFSQILIPAACLHCSRQCDLRCVL